MRMVLTPPDLPSFLANTFELKAIEGVPSDEEVKTVHAVIRALDGVSSVPGLYNVDLVLQLSQYLFSVQMTRYREQHPLVVFPTNITHTPPTLPSHFSVDLQAVTGNPSDYEIKNVQEALKMSENLSSVPSMFDADLSMKLSQHLFNLQFERYIHQAASGSTCVPTVQRPQEDRRSTPPEATDQTNTNQPASTADNLSGRAVNQPRVEHRASISGSDDDAGPESPAETGEHSSVGPVRMDESQSAPTFAEQVQDGMQSTNKILIGIEDGIKDLKRFMLAVHHSEIIARNARLYSKYIYPINLPVNSRGENPQLSALSPLPNLGQGIYPYHDRALAQYLQFYGIGDDLITSEGELSIAEGKREEAVRLLRMHLGL